MDGVDVDAGDGADAIAEAMGRLGAAERVFEASLTELEGLGMPAEAAQFVFDGRAQGGEDEMKRRWRRARGC